MGLLAAGVAVDGVATCVAAAGAVVAAGVEFGTKATFVFVAVFVFVFVFAFPFVFALLAGVVVGAAAGAVACGFVLPLPVGAVAGAVDESRSTGAHLGLLGKVMQYFINTMRVVMAMRAAPVEAACAWRVSSAPIS